MVFASRKERGFAVVCASRKESGEGVVLFIRDGLMYRERPDLGMFTKGVFASVFFEIIKGRGQRNDIIEVVYRPPGAGLEEFNNEMAGVLAKMRGVSGYTIGDFNLDLIKMGTHGAKIRLFGELHSRWVLPSTFKADGHYCNVD